MTCPGERPRFPSSASAARAASVMPGALEVLPEPVTGRASAVPLIKAQAAKVSQGERRFIGGFVFFDEGAALLLVLVNDLEFCINHVAFSLLRRSLFACCRFRTARARSR